MNSFELNKILGAILGTCLVLLALNIAAGAVFAPQKPAKPGFDIAVKEGGGEQGGAAAAKEPDQPIETLLAKASVEKGQAAAKQCQACHTFEKGGPNRVGPNLWNIVGSPRGEARGGFNFSAAMKSKGGNWTWDELNKFLANPRGYMAATRAGEAPARCQVSGDDLVFEYMLNALRLSEGFSLDEFVRRTGLSAGSLASGVAAARQRKLLDEPEPGRLRASELGWRFLDDLQALFLPDEAGPSS